jgi:hypothetical protein
MPFPVLGDLEEQVQIEPVSYWLSLSAATIISTAGWLLPNASATTAVSTMSAPGLRGLEVVHGRHAADVVAVHVHRQADLVFERGAPSSRCGTA